MGTWSLVIPIPGDTTETISLAAYSVKVRDEAGTDTPELILNAPANVYQSYDVLPRRLVLTLSPRTRSAVWPTLRSTLSAKLAPDRVATPQALTLRYAGSARTLDLPVVYAPRPGDLDREADSIDLRFVAFDPYWRASSESSQALGVRTSVTNANYVLERSAAGVWAALSTGLDGQVNTLIYNAAGTVLYAGGQFTGRAKSWSGSAWTTLGSLDGEVNVLVFGPDATLYAGGAFTGNVATWSGSAWVTLGTIGATVNDLVFGRDGVLYAVAGTNVRKYTAGAWSTVGTIGGTPDCLAVGLDGTIYCGGNATTGVKKLVSGAWTSIGSTDDTVLDLAVGLDGLLYAVGVFTTIAGVSAVRAAKYNGVSWSALSTGLADEGDVLLVLPDPDGRLVFGGAFLTAGGLVLVDSLAFWNGYAFFGADVDLPGSAQLLALAATSGGKLAVGGSFAGTAIAAVVTTSTNSGSSATPTKLVIALPAAASAASRIYALQNFTSGAEIQFSYSLLPGETLTLDLSADPKTCISSYFGDVMSGIVPGSNVASFWLLPGANSISLLVADSTATATLSWLPRYWSNDGADA